MFQRWIRFRVPVSVAALATLLAGCAGLGIRNDGTAAASGNDGASQVEEQPEWQIGPLEQFMDRILGPGTWRFSASGGFSRDNEDPTASRQYWDSRDAAEQEAISVCMHEQGFTFLPRVLTSTTFERPAGTFIPADSREWAQAFGFGITTVNDPGVSIGRWGSTIESDPEVWRRQEELLAEMSHAEQVAFDLALNGNRDRIRELEGMGRSDFTREQALELGCQNFVRWQELQVPTTEDTFSGIRTEALEGFGQIVQSDARVLQLNQNWANCMAQAGFSAWATPIDITTLTNDERNFWAGEPPFDAELYLNWDWENLPDGPPQEELLNRAEMRQREIALAVASWDCRDSLNYDAAMRDINLDLQQQFVDRHWLALEDWARAVESGTARGRIEVSNPGETSFFGLALVGNALHR